MDPSPLTACRRGRGRALYVEPDGTLYKSVHMAVHRSADDGASWRRILTIPRPIGRAVIEPVRLLCRLFRHEVRTMQPLGDGSFVVSTRQGMYVAARGEQRMTRATIDDRGLPASFPISIERLADGRLVWGEYSGVKRGRSQRIFCSDDGGRSYRVAFEFAPGQIGHIHNVFYDPALDRLWVFAGDHGPQAGMGLLTTDFRSFEWVGRGEQRWRAVTAFDFGGHLIYATDTEIEDNAVYRLDKASRRLDRLAGLDGSCIHACRCGSWYVLSTTAEPSRTAAGKVASIWLSGDGQRWRRALTCRKDRWSYRYFQFGSLVLPRGHSSRDVLMYSGQALAGVDGRLFVARLGADGSG